MIAGRFTWPVHVDGTCTHMLCMFASPGKVYRTIHHCRTECAAACGFDIKSKSGVGKQIQHFVCLWEGPLDRVRCICMQRSEWNVNREFCQLLRVWNACIPLDRVCSRNMQFEIDWLSFISYFRNSLFSSCGFLRRWQHRNQTPYSAVCVRIGVCLFGRVMQPLMLQNLLKWANVQALLFVVVFSPRSWLTPRTSFLEGCRAGTKFVIDSVCRECVASMQLFLNPCVGNLVRFGFTTGQRRRISDFIMRDWICWPEYTHLRIARVPHMHCTRTRTTCAPHTLLALGTHAPHSCHAHVTLAGARKLRHTYRFFREARACKQGHMRTHTCTGVCGLAFANAQAPPFTATYPCTAMGTITHACTDTSTCAITLSRTNTNKKIQTITHLRARVHAWLRTYTHV